MKMLARLNRAKSYTTLGKKIPAFYAVFLFKKFLQSQHVVTRFHLTHRIFLRILVCKKN